MTKKMTGIILGAILTLVLLTGIAFYAYNTVGYTLSSQEAKQIALDNAGVSESDILFSQFEKEREGLTATYNFSFQTASAEYDYTINASTGDILERDQEAHSLASSSSSTSSDSNSADTSASSAAISAEEAKAIALKDVSLDESGTLNLTVQYEIDDTVPVYEVDFIDSKAQVEYDYKISAQTGEIIERSRDTAND
ncbi:PepSY domain-containing protein [Streptococcus loxodontisalivarius]|uniref:Membrane protein YkoI n=1 Tax=Streptococcus loxodontisalivarius TaxID=1349415 RepID=A0ABS2PU33_9STRE|nr:PepSY domain-containing protein [Streptococcus loxodontisalivarius]MBM7643554.1 putative membrane protein YkoI [Streptococcus loxodontisalivarius]